MKQMLLSLLIKADAQEALRALTQTGQSAQALRGQVQGATGATQGLGAAGDQAARGVTAAAEASTGLASAAREASAGLEAEARAARNAAGETEGVGRAADGATDSFKRLASWAGKGVGALIGGVSIGMLIHLSDTWSDLSSRVGLAVGDMERAQPVMARLAQLADDTYSSLEITAEAFVANATGLTELGYATERQLDYLQALNDALVVSGARGERAAMVQDALSRAMATGTLQGIQLNTVLAYGGRVAQVLADYLGITTNQLREVAAEGRITSDVIFRALTGSMAAIRAEAEQMPATFGDGVQRVRNSLLQLIGTVDQSLGATERMAAGLISVADNLDRIAVYAGIGAVALASRYVPAAWAGVAATASMTAGVSALRIALARLPLGLALIGLSELAYRLTQIQRVAPGTGDAIGQAESAQRALNEALEGFNANVSPTTRARLIQQARKTRDLAAAALEAVQAEILLMEAEMARFAAAPLEQRGLLGDLEDRAMAENLAAARAEVEWLQSALERAVEALRQGERTNIAAPIAAGVAQASRLADELGRALRVLQQIESQSISSLREAELRWEHRADPVRLAGALARERMVSAQAPLRTAMRDNPELRTMLGDPDRQTSDVVRRAEEQARLEQRLAEWRRAQTGGGAGRGSGRNAETAAIEKQREAVTSLIDSLRMEIDILRESDPALQEMIRHRETLAAATPEERKEIEQLIRTRNAEAEILAEVQRKIEAIQQVGQDAFRGMLADLRAGAKAGEAFEAALERIAARLSDLAADHFFDMLLGGTGGGSGGGWLSSIVSGFFGIKANALGDVVGAPTLFAYGDRPGQLGLMAEAGPEAIMPLTHAFGMGVGAMFEGRETTLPLTRLASGKLGVEMPANLNLRPFAKGGVFGHVPAPPPSGFAAKTREADAAPVLQMPVTVHNYSGQPVTTRDEPDGRGGRQMTMIIGEATSAALTQPGNPARRTLERAYGVRQKAAVR